LSYQLCTFIIEQKSRNVDLDAISIAEQFVNVEQERKTYIRFAVLFKLAFFENI